MGIPTGCYVWGEASTQVCQEHVEGLGYLFGDACCEFSSLMGHWLT
jgi:hypothetical protein